jgi:hypothetical protein
LRVEEIGKKQKNALIRVYKIRPSIVGDHISERILIGLPFL